MDEVQLLRLLILLSRLVDSQSAEIINSQKN